MYQQGALSDRDLETHDTRDLSCSKTFGVQITPLHDWFAWTQFFRRSWFYRRWTLPETALARHIEAFCGDRELDWYKVKFLVRYFNSSGWKPNLRLYMRTTNQQIRALLSREFVESVKSNPEQWKTECVASYRAFNGSTILTELLYRSCLLRCADPRDIVYALLGIVDSLPQPSDACGIVVDHYNTDPTKVYLSVIKDCVETVPNLAILSLVQDFNRRTSSSLPS